MWLTAEFWRTYDNGKPEQRQKIEKLLEGGTVTVTDEDLLFRGDD